jgi:hypothetical protein
MERASEVLQNENQIPTLSDVCFYVFTAFTRRATAAGQRQAKVSYCKQLACHPLHSWKL